MAELVQLRIENTVAELEQMERIGLFTRNEIKKIVKKRKGLEYVLRRRKLKKEDILKYIQYEVNLLSLIALRRKKFQCDFKKQEIDHVIASRINKLFKTVTLRFQNDVKLWISQIEFCKRMKWHQSISGLFARMLQVHSSNPSLWIMAAKWEFEENKAPDGARKLLQRALRHHPKSKHLWLEYFRMELMYSDIVRKRRQILGIQTNTEAKDKDMENDAILDGSIASVVYKNAISTIEGVEFSLSFLPICEQFEFTQKHIEDIFEDIRLKYPNVEETLDANARYKLLFLSEEIEKGKEKGLKKRDVIANIEESITIAFEEAVKEIPTQKMWKFYIDYTVNKLKSTEKVKRKNKIQMEILKLYQRASEVDCLTSDQRINWVNMLRHGDMNSKSLEIALETARKWPYDASIWHLCLSLHIADKVNFKEVALLFTEAVSCVKDEESMTIWQLGLQWLSLVNPSKLIDFFEYGLQNNISSDGRQRNPNVISCIKVMYLEVIAMEQGVIAARDLYAKLCYSPPVPVDLYKKMIAIELAQLKPSLDKIRKYYEEALRNFAATNVDLWLNYMQFEMEHGNPEIYNMLHWRAMKALSAEFLDDFITKVALFSAGHEPNISFNDVTHFQTHL